MQTMLPPSCDSDGDFDVDDIDDTGLVSQSKPTTVLSPQSPLQSIQSNLDEPDIIKKKFNENLKVASLYAPKVADYKLLQVDSMKFLCVIAKILEIQKMAKSKSVEQQNPTLIIKEWTNKAQSLSTVLSAINSLIFDKDVQKSLPLSITENLKPSAPSLDEDEKAITTTDEIKQLNQNTLQQLKRKVASSLQVSLLFGWYLILALN